MNNQVIHLLADLPQDDEPPSLLAGWKRPRSIELAGVFLAYKPEDSDLFAPPQKKAMDRLIAEFTALHRSKEPSQTILDFARRWGVLGLCRHNRPVRHRCYANPFSKACPTVTSNGLSYEPLMGWMIYSQLIDAVIRAGGYARGMRETAISFTPQRHGQKAIPFPFLAEPRKCADESVALNDLKLPGDPADWEAINRFILRSGTPILPSAAFTSDAQAARILLMYAMVPILREAGIYLNFSWWKTQVPTFFLSGETNEYGHGGLFGALAIYTMLSLSVKKRLVKCRACPELFLLPVGRRRNSSLCQSCRKRISHLEAQKVYAARERQDPNRKKRRRLTPAQRDSIGKALQVGKPGTPERLAKKYSVTVRAIYKIGSSSSRPPRREKRNA